MWHEAVAVRYQVDDIIVEQIGFNGRNAKPGYFLYFVQRFHQVLKSLPFSSLFQFQYFQNLPGSHPSIQFPECPFQRVILHFPIHGQGCHSCFCRVPWEWYRNCTDNRIRPALLKSPCTVIKRITVVKIIHLLNIATADFS